MVPRPASNFATVAPPPRQARKLWETFSRETFAENPVPDAPLTLRGDNLYALPGGLPDLTGIQTLRTGLWLGTLRKNRLVALTQLSRWRLPQKNWAERALWILPPNASELTRYLQGDVLDAPGEDGWLLITVSGFALGWGRRSQGTVKNFYPKGLRR